MWLTYIKYNCTKPIMFNRNSCFYIRKWSRLGSKIEKNCRICSFVFFIFQFSNPVDFIFACIHSVIHSFLTSVIPSFIHSFSPSFVHSGVPPCIADLPSFIPSFMFFHSFIHTRIPSLCHSFRPWLGYGVSTWNTVIGWFFFGGGGESIYNIIIVWQPTFRLNMIGFVRAPSAQNKHTVPSI